MIELTAEQYGRIARFMDGDMDAREMLAFEQELDAVPAMREQLDFELAVRGSLFEKNMQPVEKTIAPSPEAVVPKTISITKLLVAASVIVVAGTVAFFLARKASNPVTPIANGLDTPSKQPVVNKKDEQNNNKDSTQYYAALQALYNAYFTKDTLPEIRPIYLANAFDNYEKGSYTALQQLDLEHIPQTRSIHYADSKENVLQLGHYYKGIALLETGKPDQAINHFSWVTKHAGSKELKKKAKWYMALGYIGMKEKLKAKILLDALLSDAAFGNKAKQVLSTLNAITIN